MLLFFQQNSTAYLTNCGVTTFCVNFWLSVTLFSFYWSVYYQYCLMVFKLLTARQRETKERDCTWHFPNRKSFLRTIDPLWRILFDMVLKLSSTSKRTKESCPYIIGLHCTRGSVEHRKINLSNLPKRCSSGLPIIIVATAVLNVHLSLSVHVLHGEALRKINWNVKHKGSFHRHLE